MQSFRSLCLKLAREIDSKVSALDEKCSQERDQLEQSTHSQLETRDASTLAVQNAVDELKRLQSQLRDDQEQVSVKLVETASMHSTRMDEIEHRVESGRQYVVDTCSQVGQNVKSVSSALDEHQTRCASASESLEKHLLHELTSLDARLREQHQSTSTEFEQRCQDLEERLATQDQELQRKLDDVETSSRAEIRSTRAAATAQIKDHATEWGRQIDTMANDIRENRETARVALEQHVSQSTDQVARTADSALLKLESTVNANREASACALDEVNLKLEQTLENAGRSTSELLAAQRQDTNEATQRIADQLQDQIKSTEAEQNQMAFEYSTRFEGMEQTISHMEKIALDQARALSQRMSEQMQTDISSLRSEVDDVAKSMSRQLREASDSFEVCLLVAPAVVFQAVLTTFTYLLIGWLRNRCN